MFGEFYSHFAAPLANVSHLHGLPAPLPVLGVVSQSPHVHVALDDLWPQDVVPVAQSGGRGFTSAVKPEGLGPQFGL